MLLRVVIFCLVWLSVPMAAQTPPPPPAGPLSLEDCVRLAQAAPSQVTQARHNAEIARYGLTQARSGFLPRVQYNNTFTYNSPPAAGSDPFSFVALNGNREYLSQLSTSLELDTSGKLRAELGRARADRDVATAGLGLAQRDLRRAVTAAYYRLLLARRLVVVARDGLTEARDFERRTRLLLQNGEAAQADLFKATAEAAALEQAVNATELEAQVANQDLASFWTLAVNDPLQLQDVLDQPAPQPEVVPSADAPYLKRLELTSLAAERKGLQFDARRALADMLPQANVVFAYGIDATRFSSRDRGYAAFVNLNIPVFDWFRAHSASKQFQLRASQVEAGTAMAQRAYSREYQTALARVQSLYRQIAIVETQVKASQENLRLSRVRFEGGEGLALDVVAAQNQLVQARSNYFSTLAGYYNARADLEVASAK